MASQVQQAVASFVEVLFNEPDETLTQYLITVLAETEASCIDTAELQEVVAGFSAKFEQFPAHEQHDLLWSLVTQAHSTPSVNDGRTHSENNAVATINIAEQQTHGLLEQWYTLHAVARTDTKLLQALHLHRVPAVRLRDIAHFLHTHQLCLLCSAVQSCSHSDKQAKPSSSHLGRISQQLDQLCELCPSASPAYLQHVLQHICHNSLEEAAPWVLDQDDVANSEARWHAQHALQQQEIAQAAKREKENRKQLLAKYQLQAVTSGPSVVADSKKQSSSKPVSEVRYREGMVVTSKGEKYVTEKVGQDWDGGSKGKIFTKGKRGKGTI